MLEFDTICGEGKNYTGNANMKTLMNTAMKTIMKSSLCALAAFVLSSSSAFATVLDTTLFAKKSVLTISGYSGSTTLANFPVLVRLSAGSPSGFAYADVTNGDIRFADANGNSLPFEIEKWDSSGESHVWVSVPSLSGQATTITMYYGAITGKLPPVDSTGVWSLAGYQNVHHFSDASGYMDIESSANNLTVTPKGANTVDADGVLGSSLANTGNNLFGLSVATSSCWMWEAGGTVTFSAWGKRTSDTSNRYLFGTTGAFGYANASTFTVNVNGTTASGTIPSVGDWTLYTLVIDGGTLSLYIDGTLAESKSGSLPAASAALYWGSDGSNRWKGSIDEARLRNVADTPDWIQACCDTMTNANFVAAAPVEANATTAPTFANGTTGTPLDATQFASRIPLTISGYDGSDAIENLPVLIRLGSISAQGFDISTLASDGSNFRFADALGNNLPFEIDTWDATSGKNAWVTVPYVEGTGTTIYLYFDTSATLAANDSAAVWTNACYKNVMHYQGTMDAAGCHDSTGINTEITTASTTLGTDKGKVGDGADSSNGSSTGFRFTLGDAAWGKGDPITFSTWAYTTDGSRPRPVFGDYNGTGLYCIHVNAEKQLFVCNRPPSANTVAAGVGGTKSLALTNDSNAKWCYFTFVCDGAVTKVYANGAYEGMVATPLPVMSAFAWGYANDGRYKGYCDESRDRRLRRGELQDDDGRLVRRCRCRRARIHELQAGDHRGFGLRQHDRIQYAPDGVRERGRFGDADPSLREGRRCADLHGLHRDLDGVGNHAQDAVGAGLLHHVLPPGPGSRQSRQRSAVRGRRGDDGRGYPHQYQSFHLQEHNHRQRLFRFDDAREFPRSREDRSGFTHRLLLRRLRGRWHRSSVCRRGWLCHPPRDRHLGYKRHIARLGTGSIAHRHNDGIHDVLRLRFYSSASCRRGG